MGETANRCQPCLDAEKATKIPVDELDALAKRAWAGDEDAVMEFLTKLAESRTMVEP
jgi:hypothetical protein